MRRLLGAVAVAGLLIACSSDDDDQADRTVESTANETTTPEDSVLEDTDDEDAAAAAEEADAALALFAELVEESCDPATVPVGDTATVAESDGPEFAVTDEQGSELVINVEREIVHSPQGEDAPLPTNYSFGCDPEVFVGTLDH